MNVSCCLKCVDWSILFTAWKICEKALAFFSLKNSIFFSITETQMKVIYLLILLARLASSFPETGKTLIGDWFPEGFLTLACKFLDQLLSSFIVYFKCGLQFSGYQFFRRSKTRRGSKRQNFYLDLFLLDRDLKRK